jgi:hypothetical protein
MKNNYNYNLYDDPQQEDEFFERHFNQQDKDYCPQPIRSQSHYSRGIPRKMYNTPMDPYARFDPNKFQYPAIVDMSAQMEQGNGGFGIAHSIDF